VSTKFLLLFAVALFGASPARGTHNEPPPIPETSNRCSAYVAAGQSVVGRLAAYEFMPAGWEFPPEDQRNGGGAVFLRQYLWFPNPFSSPAVVVGVTEPSSFQLILIDRAGKQLDKFAFNEIPTGVYFFALKDPILPVRCCTVRLMLEGVPSGEVESRTDRGSYKWSKATTPPPGQFEVFLLTDTTIRVSRYTGTRLADLPLAKSPWITSADISSYDWETHEIILKTESAGLMGNFRDRFGGPDIPFVVVANGERIYMGQFPWLPSSFMGSGPSIYKVDGDQPGVRIGPPPISGVPDPRTDERIKRCLTEAGLLKPQALRCRMRSGHE
jgi:hypothetical protein